MKSTCDLEQLYNASSSSSLSPLSTSCCSCLKSSPLVASHHHQCRLSHYQPANRLDGDASLQPKQHDGIGFLLVISSSSQHCRRHIEIMTRHPECYLPVICRHSVSLTFVPRHQGIVAFVLVVGVVSNAMPSATPGCKVLGSADFAHCRHYYFYHLIVG